MKTNKMAKHIAKVTAETIREFGIQLVNAKTREDETYQACKAEAVELLKTGEHTPMTICTIIINKFTL